MQEGQTPVKEFVEVREFPVDTDEDTQLRERRVLMATLGVNIANYFGIKQTDGDAESELPASISVNVVCMTREEYERLQDIEFMWKDLRDEDEE